jgi:hypothetical protein
MNRTKRIPLWVRCLALSAIMPLALAQADDKQTGGAHIASPRGLTFSRGAEGGQWQTPETGAAVAPGTIVIGLRGAAIESANGAVRLSFHPDLGHKTPYPIIETAVILKEPGDVDMHAVLDRGRIEVTNTKSQGNARVRLHVRDIPVQLDLTGPGATAALELYSRWPRGVPFSLESKDAPAWQCMLIVLKGHVQVQAQDQTFAMQAPPGPALLEWDSAESGTVRPRYLEKAPDWAADDMTSPEAQKRLAVFQHIQQLAGEKSVDETIDTLLHSSDPLERRAAVYAMAALDDIPRLAHALSHAEHADVWDAGVTALKHWIGRGPGQDQKLYQRLIDQGHFSKVDAETVLELLHTYSDEDLSRPETYEVLIDYLKSDRLAIRGLAYWHLARLVPSGRSIGYNPLDPKEKRDEAAAKWRELIPAGKLPKTGTEGGQP